MDPSKDNRLDSDVNDQGLSPLSKLQLPQASRGQKFDQQTIDNTKTGYIFYDNGLLQRIGNLSDAWKNNTWTSQRSEECFKIINDPNVDKQSGEFRMACIELSNYFKPALKLIEGRKAVLTDDQLAMVLKGCARMW